MTRFHFSSCLLAAAVFGASAAGAATPPDAGQTLQNLRKAPGLPPASTAVPIEAPTNSPEKSGGPKVEVRSFHLSGNSVFTDEQLLSLLKNARGRRFDLAEMKGLADRISAYYHTHNFPFARAIVPAQSMANGVLNIDIVEGRYGTIAINGAGSGSAAWHFLHSLKEGSLIKGKELERVSLILNDEPGYIFTPIVRPGQEFGTGDLAFLMKRDKSAGGSIGADNYGNRYTGNIRGRADVYANSLFAFGDQATLDAIYTQENMWFGSLGYSLPVGYDGLRGNIRYAHTYYQLGREFSSLDANGTADVLSIGVSYPLIRSQKANLSVSMNYLHKWLYDAQGSTDTSDHKATDSLPIALNFDMHDNVMGGGITYGSLSWTHGLLHLDSGQVASDSTTAKSNGAFDKFNLDVARLQATPVNNLTLYGRVSAQVAANNLDSSEGFGVGGPDGVRAYPTGEAYGNEGFLTQAELRYKIKSFSPYVFYDYGVSRINHQPWASGDNKRAIGGAGVGVRFAYSGWNANAFVAWRTIGGDPQSDNQNDRPLFWVSVGYTY